MSKYEDWAGDHPEQAEADLRAEAQKKLEREVADLRAEREKVEALIRKALEQSAAGDTISLGDFTQYVTCDDEHEWDGRGGCVECEELEPNFEPSDGVIPGTYEIGKAAA